MLLYYVNIFKNSIGRIGIIKSFGWRLLKFALGAHAPLPPPHVAALHTSLGYRSAKARAYVGPDLVFSVSKRTRTGTERGWSEFRVPLLTTWSSKKKKTRFGLFVLLPLLPPTGGGGGGGVGH